MMQQHQTARGGAMPPAGRVLTDTALLRCITSYQRGLPLRLYDFWVAHDPIVARSKDRDLIYSGIGRLVALVVQHGSPKLVELTASVYYGRHDWPYGKWRTRGLRGVVRQAIRANRPDILEYALVHNAPCEKLSAVWISAFDAYGDDGDLRVLEVLRLHKPISLKRNTIKKRVVKDLQFAQWLDLHFPGAQKQELMNYAASAGNMEMVQHLVEQYPTTNVGPWPFDCSYMRGHFDILRYLLEKQPRAVGSSFVEHLLKKGEKPMMEMLRDLGGFGSHAHRVAVTAIKNRNMDIFQRLVGDGLLTKDASFSIDEPAARGRLDIIKLVTERATATATTEAMDSAARGGEWNVVEYLHENRSEGCTTRAMDAAAESGSLHYVKFFHEKRTEGCTTQAMDEAAKRGSLEIVRFLHENRSEGCTTQAMDQAAGKGWLHDVVKFLHEHRTEGCTTQAMDLAAGAGHVSVVQFLQANRSEGCTAAAVTSAAQGGHLEIVRFLYEHYPSHFSPDMLHDLLLHGAFEIWLELREQYPEQANAVVEPVLLEAGGTMELATIQFVIEELGREDLAHLAVDGAANRSFHRDAQWQRTVFAITGPGSCRLSAIRNAVESAYLNDDSSPTTLQYLISVCSEKGAREMAISLLEVDDDKWPIAAKLKTWHPEQVQLSPVTPLLLDTRTPSWAIERALSKFHLSHDPYLRCQGPIPWAIQAIYRGDQTVLDVVRDLRSSGNPNVDDPMLSFQGSRAAAIRKGNLILLQWLLDNVQELPVETTLLDEALYYHQFEIAEWLAVHCVDGCREFNWSNKVKASWRGPCGLDTVLLDWVQSSAAVRSLVDFGGLASYAAGAGDLAVLKHLHASCPEVVTSRPDLKTRLRENEAKNADAIAFLEEIE